MMSDLWQTIRDEGESSVYHFGTYRVAPPSQTLRRIRPYLGHAGITRLADVTGLDYLGVPVYQAVRPASRNISVSQGKGLTREQAQVSALMESLESFHAENIPLPSRRETVSAMRRELRYSLTALPLIRKTVGASCRRREYDLFAPPVGAPTFLRDSMPIDWLPATDLSDGTSTWVPRQLCELNFCVGRRLCLPLFRATSNGLASGNNITEALIHGLCEVIERDSAHRNKTAWADPAHCINCSTISSRIIERLLERFARCGVKTHIVDVSGPTGLPCFEAFIADFESATYKGLGCHMNRSTALLRALTEAAQGRLAHITGSRDDLYRSTYRLTPLAEPKQKLPSVAESRKSFTDAPTLPVSDLSAALKEIVRRVRTATGFSPLAVNLTKTEFNIPVVFVVAPGLKPPTAH